MFIVTIEKKDFKKLDNSDRLYVTTVDGVPCIVGVDMIEEGDFLYCPLDVVLSLPLYSLLNRKDEYSVRRARIRACRLRGTFSEGLLLPLSQVEKIYPKINASPNPLELTNSFIYRDMEDMEDKDKVIASKRPNIIQKILSFFKPKHNLTEYVDTSRVEKVNVKDGVYIPTLKIHGTSVRYGLTTKFLWFKQKLVIGSRRTINPNNKLYLQMAVKYNIEAELLRLSKMMANPVIVGEIAGEGVQKGFPYESEVKLYAYGLHGNNQWYSYEQMVMLLDRSIPVVPCLGRYIHAPVDKEGLLLYLESLCNTTHYPSIDSTYLCREGIVLQLAEAQPSNNIHNRIVYKYISEAYRSK